MIKRVSHGFVFITMLVFLQLYLLLGLYELTLSRIGLRMNDESLQWEESHRLVGHLLRHVEAGIAANPTKCLIPLTLPSVLVQKTDSWWRRHACGGIFRGIRYHYAAELLGDDVCGFLEKTVINQKVIAVYYRITLRAQINKRRNEQIILQSTLAQPGDHGPHCPGVLHKVSAGHQMQRELIGRRLY